MIYIAGPGHGGPGMVANTYLEGTYSEIYPQHSAQTRTGMKRLFRQFSFPAAFRATWRRKRPARSTRAANSAIAVPCLRRGLRQSRSDRRLRRRRWRGGNRAAGDVLAFQQIPQPGDVTARCCRFCISTATRSPIRPCWRASARGTGQPAQRLWLQAVVRRRRRSRDRCIS